MKKIDYNKYWSPAFDTMGDFVFLLDRDFKMVKVNKAFARFTKKSQKLLVGKKCYSVVHHKNIPIPLCPHKKVLRTKKPEHVECYEPYHKKWLDVSVTPIFDDKHQLVGSIHVTVDITKRKKTELELVEKQKEIEFKAEMLDQAPAIIAHHDLNHNIIWANKFYLDVVGLSLEELKGKKCWKVWNLKKPCNNCPVITTLKTGKYAECLLTPENQDHWPEKQGSWLSSSSAIKDENGKIIGAIETSINVTKRRQVEKALLESEQKYRNLAESLDVAIFRADPKTWSLTYANPAVEKIYGYTVDEWLSDPEAWVKSVHPEDKDRVFAEAKKSEAAGEPCLLEYRILRKNGDSRWVQGQINWEKADGKLVSVYGICYDITERKKAENALKEAKEYTEGIISSMVEALIVLNPDGTIQTVNQATCDLLNYNEKSLLGQPIGMFIAEEEEEEEEEEERRISDKRFHKILHKGPILDFRAFFSTKGGEKVPVSISGSVMRDKKGKLIGVILTARDMRAKIAAENALKESEERYRGVVENITNAIFLLDEKGRFVHMNKPGLELNGLKEVEGIVGKSFIASSHKKYRGILTRAVDTVWSGRPIDCHYESKTAEGLHKWWECIMVPFRDASGEVVNAIGISRDVTEHKQAEKLIKFFREYAENIVANLPVSILVVNRALEISFVNQHFARRMRKAKENLIGKNLNSILGKTFIKDLHINTKIEHVIKGVAAFYEGRFTWRQGNYDYRILPFKERMGQRKNAMLVMEDVTDKVQLEEQVRHSEKMAAVGEFTASVAHEINNPLSVILGNIQYLLSNVGQLDFTQKEQLKNLTETLVVIEDESRRCGEIVTNLLHFSHRAKVEKTEVAINKIISRTMRMMEHQLKLAKVKTEVDLGKNIPSVKGDANLLQQVFVNLILNAQAAMGRGGRLYIKTAMENSEWIKISFRDTGPGIPQKYLRRIFEPFFTTKESGKGTGLGLSVVHSIIDEHGGNIGVKSQKGTGATFTVRLPVSRKKGLFDVRS